MEAKLLNPFLSSFSQAISMFLGCDVQKKGVQAITSLNSNTGVHVFLGITGDLYGTVLLSTAKKSALQIASAMAGMNFKEFDDISASALQELLNVTAGGASTRLSEMSLRTEITPPMLVTGDKIDVRLSLPMISVRLGINSIDVYLNLSVKKRKPTKVLIVDSNSVFRTKSVDIISSNGFKIIGECSNGLECLNFIQSNKPDIILYDLSKSEAVEMQILEQIKQKYPAIKIIVAITLGQKIPRAVSLNIDGYVTKPYGDKALLTVLKKL